MSSSSSSSSASGSVLYGGNIFERPRTVDPAVDALCRFFLRHLVLERDQNLEIEAKLGRLVVRDAAGGGRGSRLDMGARNRVLFESLQRQEQFRHGLSMHFVSGVAGEHFMRLNRLLNERTRPGLATQGGRRVPDVTYRHSKETDRYYSGRGGKPSVRVSVDGRGRVLRALRKERVDDLNVHCPGEPYDLRVSASREVEVSDVPTGACDMLRVKDRRSYRFDVWSFDITKVDTFRRVGADNQPAADAAPEVSYEVEVELLEGRVEFMRGEFEKARDNKRSAAVQAVKQLLDNMQTLSLFSAGGEVPRLVPAPQRAANVAAAAAAAEEEEEEEKGHAGKRPRKE